MGLKPGPQHEKTPSTCNMVQPTDVATSKKKIIAIWEFLLTLEPQNGHNVLRPCDRSSWGLHPCRNQSLAGSVLYQPRHVPTYTGTVELQQQSF
jgi:hypothetical protein